MKLRIVLDQDSIPGVVFNLFTADFSLNFVSLKNILRLAEQLHSR